MKQIFHVFLVKRRKNVRGFDIRSRGRSRSYIRIDITRKSHKKRSALQPFGYNINQMIDLTYVKTNFWFITRSELDRYKEKPHSEAIHLGWNRNEIEIEMAWAVSILFFYLENWTIYELWKLKIENWIFEKKKNFIWKAKNDKNSQLCELIWHLFSSNSRRFSTVT